MTYRIGSQSPSNQRKEIRVSKGEMEKRINLGFAPFTPWVSHPNFKNSRLMKFN